MKKLIALLLCILLLAGCGQTYTGPTETVWVLRETTSERFSPFTENERIAYSYDIYGNQDQEMHYNDDVPYVRKDYTYDDNGNLIQEETYDVQGLFPRRTYKFIYTYNEDGDLLTSEQYEQRLFSLGLVIRHEYTYNDHGDLLTRNNYFYNGDDLQPSMRSEYTYNYDDQGRLLSYVAIDDDGQYSEHYEYDDEANSVTAISDDGRSVSFYDENGFLIRYVQGTSTTEYTRRLDGELLTEHFTNGSGVEHTTFYEYDDHGNLIAIWRQEGDVRTELDRRRYDYDDQGRRVAQYDLRNGGSKKVFTWAYNGEYRTEILWSDNQKGQETVYDGQGHEIERIIYEDGEIFTRKTWTYIEIQVPIKEESP